MSQVPSITPATAPRTAEALSKIGRFQIRTLAEALGLFGTPEAPDAEARQAFMKMETTQQTTEVLAALAEFDKENGAPTTAAPAAATTSRFGNKAAANGAAGPATAPAAAAEAPKAGGFRGSRTPVNKGVAAGDPATAQGGGGNAPAPSGGNLDISPVMNALGAILETVNKASATNIANQKVIIEELKLNRAIGGATYSTVLATAEGALGRDVGGLLVQALSETGDLVQEISNAGKGK